MKSKLSHQSLIKKRKIRRQLLKVMERTAMSSVIPVQEKWIVSSDYSRSYAPINKECIIHNREFFVEELYSWATTFEDEVDDEGEPSSEAFDFVWSLAEKLKKDSCSEKDYEDIRFHLWQMNDDDERWQIAVKEGKRIFQHRN